LRTLLVFVVVVACGVGWFRVYDLERDNRIILHVWERDIAEMRDMADEMNLLRKENEELKQVIEELRKAPSRATMQQTLEEVEALLKDVAIDDVPLGGPPSPARWEELMRRRAATDGKSSK